MIAELMAKIGVDISDLNKAEVALKNFGEKFKDAFKRPPSGEMRAEAAIGGAIRQFAAGDLPGAIESVVRRMGSIGIVGGVAFGVVLTGISKVIDASKEASAAFEAMGESLRGIAPQAAQGVEALGTRIQASAAELGKESGKTFGGKMKVAIGDYFRGVEQNPLRLIPAFAIGEHLVKGGNQFQEDREAIRAGKVTEVTTALEQQGRAYADIADLAKSAAQGDAEATANKKAQAEYTQEMVKLSGDLSEFYKNIKDAELDMTALEKQRLAVAIMFHRTAREKAALDNQTTKGEVAGRAGEMRDEELIMQQQIAAVKEKGLSADVEKIALAQVNIQHLAAQLQIQEGIVDAEDEAAVKLKAAQADIAGDEKRRGVKKFESTLDQSLYTVDELAKMKHTGWIGGDLNMAQVNAREIQRLENRARIEKEQGHPMEAFAALNRAQQLRAGMPLLKSSEKNTEFAFAAAIDSASVFKSMVEYLQKMADALASPNNPFLNK
jgi:hypothetical protein